MGRIFARREHRFMIVIFVFFSISVLLFNDNVEGAVHDHIFFAIDKDIRIKESNNIKLVENSHSAKVNGLKVIEDLGMSRINQEQRPKSGWIESEKALYRNLLKHSTYDVLVVPFQVQGYAIDRIGRSLMTRYLINHVEIVTGSKIPAPTFVARALGQNARTFNEHEVYQLANDLGVKTLIRGYVGHDRDEKMRITLFVQTRENKSSFDTNTKGIQVDFQDIPFSDEHPPSEAFLDQIKEMVSKLPLKTMNKYEIQVYKKIQQLLMPETILSMVTNKPDSPIINAYYLQFLGMLFPEHSTTMEDLFERSLVALSNVSPKSPDYAILKSRAYFYLYRRPAALATLGKPTTPEEKAFLALLNGNLSDLEKVVNEIKSPLQKLIAKIELIGIRSSYGQHRPGDTEKFITEKLSDWEMILTRILNNDPWYIQSNLEIKQKLDGLFPIPNFTAKNLAMSRVVIGEEPREGEDIDFSVYNHYHKLLTNQPEQISNFKNASYPEKMDYLYLLVAIGESNLMEKISLYLYTKSLPDSALQLISSYETIYRGHPELTYLKAEALRQISETKQGQVRENLQRSVRENAYNVYYWSQGQTWIAHKSLFLLDLIAPYPPQSAFYFYNADYPKRCFWNNGGEGDRKVLKNSYSSMYGLSTPGNLKSSLDVMKNNELALLYTNTHFKYLEDLYNAILLQKKQYEFFKLKPNFDFEKDADHLLELNSHRFHGNPRRMTFLAKQKKDTDDSENAQKLYEKAIKDNPEVWSPYMKLGSIYIKQGEFKKALSTFQRYPMFAKRQSDNMVEMSNHALEAAIELWWCGAVAEAMPLFKLAANSETGSAAEMKSSAYLNLLGGDHAKAAFHFLQLIKRYNDKYGYRDYMALLHLMGFHKESWALFDTIDLESYSPYVWTAALIGNRMESKTDEEIFQWLLQDNIRKVPFYFVGRYFLMAYLIDRSASQDLPKLIEAIRGKSIHPLDQNEEVEKSYLAWFAEGYYHTRKGDFARAQAIFKERYDYFKDQYDTYNFVLPYIAWNSVKSSKLSEIEDLLKTLENKYGDFFDFHLSKGFLYGLQGNHQKAVHHLKFASYRMPPTGFRPLFGWYQLVEACEWLYEDTKHAEYRNLALYWAKLHQQMQPMFAWAYAVEAKYTDSPVDRLRALAMTLYLDKRSERIAGFSEPDKAKALEWLKKNNPFLKSLGNNKNLRLTL